jgi:hypothetical protein
MSFDTKRPSAAQASEDGHTFEPVYPDGSGIGATITVRGPRSSVVREYARRQFAQTQAREATARKVGKLLEPPELDELDESLTEMAVTYTLGWDGMTADDQPLPFTAEAARSLYTDHPWLREQVIAEGQDLGKFVSPSRKNFSSTPKPSSA